MLVTIANTGGTRRELSAFSYYEWWLGPPREGRQFSVVTEYLEPDGVVLARNALAEALGPWEGRTDV